MSAINRGMSRYFGLIPSLYESLDDQAVALLEIAIYNRELGFHTKALSIFRNGLKKWLDIPIVLYEYAQTFLGQEKVKDACTVLSTYVARVDGDDLDQPEIRLLALTLAFAEIYHIGNLERAVKEVNRTRDWLKDIPVDRYTDVQIAVLGLYLMAEAHVFVLSSQSVPENERIPKSDRSPKPWRGLADMQTLLLEGGRLDQACYLATRLTMRHSTKQFLIRKERKVLDLVSPASEDVVTRQKLILLEIRLRISIATKLCDIKEFQQATAELNIAGNRLLDLGPVFGLDSDEVSQTSLTFRLRLAKVGTIPKSAFEDKFTETMALLRNSEEACHGRLAQCYLDASQALKNLYQKTGEDIWREGLVALVEEKENFELNVLGDVLSPLMAHSLNIPDFDLGFNDMSEEDIEKIVQWYEDYATKHPDFEIPRIALQVAQLKVAAYVALCDFSRLEQAILEMQEWEFRLSRGTGNESMRIGEESETNQVEDSELDSEEDAARYSESMITATALGDLFDEMKMRSLPDPNGKPGFPGQELLVQWIKSDVNLESLGLEEAKLIFDDENSTTPVQGDGSSDSPFNVDELNGDNIPTRIFGPPESPISDALWIRRKSILKDWLRRRSQVEQIQKDFVLLQLYIFRLQQLQKFGTDLVMNSDDNSFEDIWDLFVMPCVRASKDCLAVLDEIHPALRSHSALIYKKMELKLTICNLVATGIGTREPGKTRPSSPLESHNPALGMDAEIETWFAQSFPIETSGEGYGDLPSDEQLQAAERLLTDQRNYGEQILAKQRQILAKQRQQLADKRREYSERPLSDWTVKMEKLLLSDELKGMIAEACEICRELISYYESEVDSWEALAFSQMLLAWMLLFKVRLQMADSHDQEHTWLAEGLELLEQAHTHTTVSLRRRRGGNILASFASKEDFQLMKRTHLISSTALNLLWDKGNFDQQDTECIWKWVQRSKAKALDSMMNLGKPQRTTAFDTGAGGQDESQLTLEDLAWIAKISGNDSIAFVDWFSVPIFPGDPYGRLFMIIVKPGGRPIIEDLGMTDGDLSLWRGIKMPSFRWSKLQEFAQEYNDSRVLEESMCDAREKSALAELGGLIKPLSKHTSPGDLLVFCPSNYLHQVPLHGLELPIDQPDISLHELSEANDRLVLIHRNPVVYCYSLSVLRRNCRRAFAAKSDTETKLPREVAIFGDIAHHSDPSVFKAGRDSVRELGDWFNTTPYLGKKATKSSFFEKAPRSSLIHFHTHVASDDPNPMAHAILLSPGLSVTPMTIPDKIKRNPLGQMLAGETSSHADYLKILDNESLTAGEISSLVELNSPCHVTIIACSGGRLRVDQGDEVMGLIPAFMVKGATSALGTLWRTRDDVGAEFTKRFYKFFQEKNGNGLVDLAKAFQSAIVSMDPEAVQPPYFWAGFVLYGYWMYQSPEVTQADDHPWNSPFWY